MGNISTRNITDTIGLVRHWNNQFSPNTLEKWRHTGGGPPFMKVGRSVRYDVAMADKWLDDRLHKSTSEYACHPLLPEKCVS